MSDFIRLAEKEVKTRATLIFLEPDSESKKNLRRFLNQNHGLVSSPKRDFHSTIHYSVENPVFQRDEISQKIRSRIPITISPENYSLDVFKDRELVLRYKSQVVRDLNDMLINEGVRQMVVEYPSLGEEERDILREYSLQIRSIVYDNFNPHLSLARNFNRDRLEDLTVFDEEIVFDDFAWVV